MQIKTTDAPRLFGVTRQTLSTWARRLAKVPKTALVTLLELENKAHEQERTAMQRAEERRAAISETVARINAGDFDPLGTEAPKQGRPRKGRE
ncbi:MAG: hypothetical protein PHD67_09225 [Oscillospiraceae bacterium]|nr:hypothetical protein [Oscillospiraceae bacterium]